jgi:hypothetical protein
MTKEELTKLSDEELLIEKKKLRNVKIINAVLIGFLFGIIIYSVVQNTWGFLTLIPLYLIYRLVNNSKSNKELEEYLKERKLD